MYLKHVMFIYILKILVCRLISEEKLKQRWINIISLKKGCFHKYQHLAPKAYWYRPVPPDREYLYRFTL